MLNFVRFVLAILVCCICETVHADTFGSVPNEMFEIEFVPIGSPGNIADMAGSPNPAGSVSNSFRIGKYEISEDMVRKANSAGNLGITLDTRGPNKPATNVNWFEAAKFVNWLNTSTNNTSAYKFDNLGNFQLWDPNDVGYDPNNLYRNSLAKYFLPSVDEWYKAAYYNPSNDSYFLYPTGSNTAPTAVTSGTMVGTAVYGQFLRPADITLAGGPSPFGTVGQGGNVAEWEETSTNLSNDSPSGGRGYRGGNWENSSASMLSTFRLVAAGDFNTFRIGFRVASVIPEPTSCTLSLTAVCLVLLKRRR